ncbi:hypothetical protein NPIL_219741, partial [Nephila pilipes]
VSAQHPSAQVINSFHHIFQGSLSEKAIAEDFFLYDSNIFKPSYGGMLDEKENFGLDSNGR